VGVGGGGSVGGALVGLGREVDVGGGLVGCGAGGFVFVGGV